MQIHNTFRLYHCLHLSEVFISGAKIESIRLRQKSDLRDGKPAKDMIIEPHAYAAGRSSTTTGPCSTTCSAAPPTPCSVGLANRVLKWVSSARSTPTAGNAISIRISTSPLPAVVSTSNTTSGGSCSLKRTMSSKSAAKPSFTCYATNMRASIPAACRASAISATNTGGIATCMRNIAAHGRCILPKKPAEPGAT